MLEILISKGADVNAKGINHQNIKLEFLIKILLNQWRKLNKKNKTPLHITAFKNSKEIGELLISKGADINAIDNIYRDIKILFLIKRILNK